MLAVDTSNDFSCANEMTLVVQGMLQGSIMYVSSRGLAEAKALGIRWAPTDIHSSTFWMSKNPDRNAEISCRLCNHAAIFITVAVGSTVDPKGWQKMDHG